MNAPTDCHLGKHHSWGVGLSARCAVFRCDRGRPSIPRYLQKVLLADHHPPVWSQLHCHRLWYESLLRWITRVFVCMVESPLALSIRGITHSLTLKFSSKQYLEQWKAVLDACVLQLSPVPATPTSPKHDSPAGSSLSLRRQTSFGDEVTSLLQSLALTYRRSFTGTPGRASPGFTGVTGEFDPVHWIPDQDVSLSLSPGLCSVQWEILLFLKISVCMVCQETAFSMVVRKHHCR